MNGKASSECSDSGVASQDDELADGKRRRRPTSPAKCPKESEQDSSCSPLEDQQVSTCFGTFLLGRNKLGCLTLTNKLKNI